MGDEYAKLFKDAVKFNQAYEEDQIQEYKKLNLMVLMDEIAEEEIFDKFDSVIEVIEWG